MENEFEKFEEALTRSGQASQEKIGRWDDSQIEEQLIAQTVVLENMFQIYFKKMITTDFLGAQEIFGRLALKSQNQARKTLSTIAELRNPKKLTFIKQQNNAQFNVKQEKNSKQTSGDA